MEAFSRRPADYSRQMRVKVDSVRLLTSDTAVVDGVLEYSAGTGVDGRREPLTLEPFTAMMVQHDGGWHIAASRVGPNMLARKFVRLQLEPHDSSWSMPHLDSADEDSP